MKKHYTCNLTDMFLDALYIETATARNKKKLNLGSIIYLCINQTELLYLDIS